MLHIGTEKTGSTSIQTFLSTHRSTLIERGVLFPQSCGLTCHSRLVAYTKEQPDERLLNMIAVPNEAKKIAAWKSKFRKRHHKEVTRFHATCLDNSTVIYSSEHFQSLVRDLADIERVHCLLQTYYDKITLVVYLKRQDHMAFSAHNTAVQSGLDKRFSFDDMGTGYYYDHLQLVSQWAKVFGDENVKVRVCEKPRLHKQSVVSDLLQLAELDEKLSDLPQGFVSNKRLSQTAIELLIRFNREYGQRTHIDGVPMSVFRQNLIEHLRSIDSECYDARPSKQAARRFCAQFEVSNAALFDRFLKGKGFDQSFAEYPEQEPYAASEVPCELLSSVIDQVLLSQEVG